MEDYCYIDIFFIVDIVPVHIFLIKSKQKAVDNGLAISRHKSSKKKRNKEKFTVVAIRMKIQRALLNAEERKVCSTFPSGDIERRLKS